MPQIFIDIKCHRQALGYKCEATADGVRLYIDAEADNGRDSVVTAPCTIGVKNFTFQVGEMTSMHMEGGLGGIPIIEPADNAIPSRPKKRALQDRQMPSRSQSRPKQRLKLNPLAMHATRNHQTGSPPKYLDGVWLSAETAVGHDRDKRGVMLTPPSSTSEDDCIEVCVRSKRPSISTGSILSAADLSSDDFALTSEDEGNDENQADSRQLRQQLMENTVSA